MSNVNGEYQPAYKVYIYIWYMEKKWLKIAFRELNYRYHFYLDVNIRQIWVFIFGIKYHLFHIFIYINDQFSAFFQIK